MQRAAIVAKGWPAEYSSNCGSLHAVLAFRAKYLLLLRCVSGLSPELNESGRARPIKPLFSLTDCHASRILRAPGSSAGGAFGRAAELLRKLGGNLQPLLVALRLPGDVLDDPNRLLPILTVGELLAQAAEQVKCEHLGLLLGTSAGIGQLGAIGQMMRLMPTVGSATGRPAAFDRAA